MAEKFSDSSSSSSRDSKDQENPEERQELRNDINPETDPKALVAEPRKYDPQKYWLSAKRLVDEPEPKPKKLTYLEKRRPENRKEKFRNYHKFVGILPDFRGFERVRQLKIIDDKPFREKRLFKMIFVMFKPDELVLKMARVCKKFYILSWDPEVLNSICFVTFGLYRYNKIRYKCAQRIKACEQGNQLAEDKPRWLIEDSTDTQDESDDYKSNEEADHMRHDGNSSAEEENDFKDLMRKKAKEEYEEAKRAKATLKQKEEDMKTIEECKFNKEAVPTEIRARYQDEMSEFQDYNYKKKQEQLREEGKLPKLSKREQLQRQINEQRSRQERQKLEFSNEVLGEDGPEFKRKLFMFISLKKRCFNCGYFENKIDSESMLVVCPVLNKPICHSCKMSEAFQLISATSASKKFKVDKKDIDMLHLPYVDAPNPHYTALKMNLYYEFMIVENLPKIEHWRSFKDDKKKQMLREHMAAKKKAKVDSKRAKTLFTLEIEFKRRGIDVTRDHIISKFIDHPYMERFLLDKLPGGKVKKNLSEIIDMIESGEADDAEERLRILEGKRLLKKQGIEPPPMPQPAKERKPRKRATSVSSDNSRSSSQRKKKKKKVKKHKKIKKKKKTVEEKTAKLKRKAHKKQKLTRARDLEKTILRERQQMLINSELPPAPDPNEASEEEEDDDRWNDNMSVASYISNKTAKTAKSTKSNISMRSTMTGWSYSGSTAGTSMGRPERSELCMPKRNTDKIIF